MKQSQMVMNYRMSQLPSPRGQYANWELSQLTLPRKEKQVPILANRYDRCSTINKRMHKHAEMEICYIPNDYGTFNIGDDRFPFEPGDIFLIKQNTFHQAVFHSAENNGLAAVYFMPEQIPVLSPAWEQLNSFANDPSVNHYCIRGNQSTQKLVLSMLRHFYLDDKYWQIRCEGILVHLLSFFVCKILEQQPEDTSKQPLPNDSRVQKAIRFIEENLDTQINAQSLYQLSGLSRSQFSQLFKSHFGKSASAYIQERRIHRAKELLQSSTLTITEICFCCGFNWAGFFNRAFKKHAGMTPSEFREFHNAGR